MNVEVIVAETKPRSDIASRLAMVYSLLLRLAQDAEAEHTTEKPGRTAAGLAEAGDESDFHNQIPAPHDPPLKKPI